MSPLIPRRPGPAVCSPFAALTLLAPLALAVSTSAAAGTLAANGSYVGENHSHEDHHGESLKNIDLSKADLTGSDFSSAVLQNAKLVSAIAVDTLFVRTNLQNADLTGAVLTGADLEGATLKNAKLPNAMLWNAKLSGADLQNADLGGASLIGADLTKLASSKNTNFAGAYFDAKTQLDAGFDTSKMLLVVGVCPYDSKQYWIDKDRDGKGDSCQGAAPLPEPGAAAGIAGIALVAALAHRRRLCAGGAHGNELRGSDRSDHEPGCSVRDPGGADPR